MRGKIIIVTVHNSENCGSYLQAFAMQKVLHQLEYDVAFLYRDTKGTSHDKKRTLRIIWNLIKHLRLSDALIKFHQWQTYEQLHSKLHICHVGDSFYNEANHVILGSDTIWNFENEYFRQTAKRLLGTRLSGKHIISYAASAGNTSAETFQKVADMQGGIGHISTLLVRDNHTRDILKESYNKDSELVCDPTLLLQPEDFSDISTPQHISHPYLLLYYFGAIPAKTRAAILQYAQTHEMKIVSLLTKRDWCNSFVPSSPGNMISCYAGASAVVTNTFHGCALSLIYQVPFAAHEEGKIKVRELLDTYNSSERLFSYPDELSYLLNNKPNNKALVTSLSIQSLEKLKQALQ